MAQEQTRYRRILAFGTGITIGTIGVTTIIVGLLPVPDNSVQGSRVLSDLKTQQLDDAADQGTVSYSATVLGVVGCEALDPKGSYRIRLTLSPQLEGATITRQRFGDRGSYDETSVMTVSEMTALWNRLLEKAVPKYRLVLVDARKKEPEGPVELDANGRCQWDVSVEDPRTYYGSLEAVGGLRHITIDDGRGPNMSKPYMNIATAWPSQSALEFSFTYDRPWLASLRGALGIVLGSALFLPSLGFIWRLFRSGREEAINRLVGEMKAAKSDVMINRSVATMRGREVMVSRSEQEEGTWCGEKHERTYLAAECRVTEGNLGDVATSDEVPRHVPTGHYSLVDLNNTSISGSREFGMLTDHVTKGNALRRKVRSALVSAGCSGAYYTGRGGVVYLVLWPSAGSPLSAEWFVAT